MRQGHRNAIATATACTWSLIRPAPKLGLAHPHQRAAHLICEGPTLKEFVVLLENGDPAIGIFAAEAGQIFSSNGRVSSISLRVCAMLAALWDGVAQSRVCARGRPSSLLDAGSRPTS